MKYTLLLITALGTHGLCAQEPDLQWLRTAGGFGNYQESYRHVSAVDATGHLYTVGHATDADYGSGVVVEGEAYVLARYDSTGTVEWARAINTLPAELENVEALAITSTGDVWVAGGFGSGTLTIDEFVLTNNGSHSPFMVRFNASGEAQEAKTWGGMNNDVTELRDIYVDAQDRVYVTGSTNAASITIDGITLTNTATGDQILTLAFATDGTALWGNMTDSPPGGAPRGRCIAADSDGRAYVAAMAIEDVVIGGTTLLTGGQDMALLVRYSNTGAVEHAQTMAVFMPWDIAVDDDGQAYVCGHFGATITLNGITMVPIEDEGLVAAFPGDGTCAWAVSVAGEHESEACYSVVLDAARTHLLLGGVFAFHAWFGDLNVESGLQPYDGFVMHMGTDGTVNWVKVLTGDAPSRYVQAMYDPADRIHASGVIQSTVTYIGEPVENSIANTNSTFLARFDELVTGVTTLVQADAALPYPDPCNGTFTIDLPADARTVVITDARGRVLQNTRAMRAQRSSFTIDTPGVYFVSVLTDSGHVVQRVVVE